MHPVLFRIGEFPVGTYALTALIGLAAGVAVFSWLGGRAGYSRMDFLEMGLWLFIVGILSSKIFGAVLEFDPQNPGDSVIRVVRFGGHFLVGFLAAVAYLVWALRKRGVSLGRGLDCLVPGVAIGHAIGRIGCFLAGCCWGKACTKPWAVTFTSAEANDITGVPLHVALHPTQLYELGVELVLFGVLLVSHLSRRSPPFAGRTFLQYVVLYGVARFFLEFLRDDPRGGVAGLSTSQALGSVSVLAAIIGYVVIRKRSAAAPESKATSEVTAGASHPPAASRKKRPGGKRKRRR